MKRTRQIVPAVLIVDHSEASLVPTSVIVRFPPTTVSICDRNRCVVVVRLQSKSSGGAKEGGGAAGARAPVVKPCALAVPRQLRYSDVDHLNESVGSEQQLTSSKSCHNF